MTQPGRESPYRKRSVDENLDLFRRMRAGEFPDGAHVLRAQIDMASPNMLMRDPLLYRIRHAVHYRRGDAWCIYPLYDYAHPLEDALECVTHSLCTLEFENNRELYDWVVENAGLACRPEQIEFARLALDYTVMSKRKLLRLVNGGFVSGWDDPRMPTIAGLRRRGVTPEAIRAFCDLIGVAKANSRVDIAKLEYAIRDDLNRRVPRVLCVPHPLRVVIENWPENHVDWLDAPYYPHDVPLEGSRALPFSRVLYIDRDDFREEPPPGWFRLTPGAEVRLRYAYIVRCTGVVKNEAGDVVELRCVVDPDTRGGATPDGRQVRGTIQWLSADHALPAEVRLYDRLFTVPDPEAAAESGDRDFTAFLNPQSLVVAADARIEPSAAEDPPGTRYQFERVGYFMSDTVDSRPGRLVFNRTVTLRDSWVKGAVDEGRPGESRSRARAGARARETDTTGARQPGPAAAPERAAELEARRRRYVAELGLDEESAEILTREAASSSLFEDAVSAGGDARSVANWIVHELPRAAEGRSPAELPFGGPQLARLVQLLSDGAISSSGAREVLSVLAAEGGDPAEIVERKGLRQVSDEASLGALVDQVLDAHPQKVEQYRGGRGGLLGFFVGQAMRRSGGSANPELLRKLLEERLR